jgi:CHASE3 domain sensor protein
MKLSDMKIATRLYLGFACVIALLAVMVVVAMANFVKLAQANAINTHTYEVLAEVDGMLENLINIETGQRGYVITGQQGSLEPLNGGKAGFKARLDKARALTADNPAQQERLLKLEQVQGQWMAAAIEPVLALRKGAGDDAEKVAAVVANVREGRGKQGMDGMRAMLAEIGKTESSLLAQRALAAADLQTQTGAVLVGGGLVTALLAAMIAFWLGRNVSVPPSTWPSASRRAI